MQEAESFDVFYEGIEIGPQHMPQPQEEAA